MSADSEACGGEEVNVTPTGAPDNYDNGQTISVYPTAVFEYTFYQKNEHGLSDATQPQAVIDGAAYGVVPELLNIISDSFQKIFDTWNSLKISWAGDSSDAAQELNDQLNKIQKRLFGANVKPVGDVPGVIGQMSSVAASAAVNYSNVEEANTKMFDDMNHDIPYKPLPPEDTDDSGDGGNDDSDSSFDPKKSNQDWNYAPVNVQY
ncbi:hypothetical protein GCM10023322_08360 [Rugosimonospora acidiphila]|uniref:Uncharacterized protein n=1 Tax=Rugosimonospora acidiphila TaxID=556531 RepID=A0ABP9RJV5_9ACTN